MATFSRYPMTKNVDPQVRRRAVDALAEEEDRRAQPQGQTSQALARPAPPPSGAPQGVSRPWPDGMSPKSALRQVDQSKLAQGQPPQARPMPTPTPGAQAPRTGTTGQLTVDPASRAANPRDAQWNSVPINNTRDAQWNALPTSGNPAPPQDDDLSDVARLRVQQEKERQAAVDDMKAERARRELAAAARANRGSLGLGGGAAALLGDLGRQEDRNATLTLADFDRKQRDELRTEQDQNFKEIQQRAALWDLEEADHVDYDGDHNYGPPDDAHPDPKTPGERDEDRDAFIADVAASNKGLDLWQWDSPGAQPGSEEVPYHMHKSQKKEMEKMGFIFSEKPASGIPREKSQPDRVNLYTDQDGHVFIFT